MRSTFIYMLIIIVFNTCKAQNIKKTENTFEIPEITKEFEKLQIQNISNKHIVNDNELYSEIEKQSYGFISRTFFKNSCFKLNKKFYENFNLMSKGIMFNNGSRYGIWYEFDKEGKRTAAIDTDIGYDYGWDDILAYCKENDIPLTKGHPERGGIKTEIHKDEEGGKKVWTLRYNNNKTFQYLEVTLDGRTGAVLNQRELEFH